VYSNIFTLETDQMDSFETLSLPMQHTLNHVDCPACEAIRTDTLGHDPDSLLSQKFPAAAKLWLATRKPYLDDGTFYMYSHHVNSLSKFFAEIELQKIHLGHLRAYQLARMKNADKIWRRPAGPSLINHEMSIVQQVLKRAGRWKLLAHHYEPLPIPRSQKPKVMTETEEKRLFEVAASSPQFEIAFLAASLSVNTTACGSELRNVRLGDVFLGGPTPKFIVDADTAKNGFRGRTIPLNKSAADTMLQCIYRANACGSFHPEHYLFPKRLVRGLWDPYKPASTSWLRVSFNAMREAAALPWLTPHCLRHQAITKLLELNTPPEIVKGIAGHVSDAMMKHYFHGRYAAASSALDKIDSNMNVRTGKIQSERA
jgi:integrase